MDGPSASASEKRTKTLLKTQTWMVTGSANLPSDACAVGADHEGIHVLDLNLRIATPAGDAVSALNSNYL